MSDGQRDAARCIDTSPGRCDNTGASTTLNAAMPVPTSDTSQAAPPRAPRERVHASPSVGEPIVTREAVSLGYKHEERAWTYDEILDLFPDGDGSLVNPLVRRCQQYEAEIERLREQLSEKLADPASPSQSSHWDGCWRVHPKCAEYHATHFLAHAFGEEAARQGDPENANPHEPKTVSWEAWQAGWRAVDWERLHDAIIADLRLYCEHHGLPVDGVPLLPGMVIFDAEGEACMILKIYARPKDGWWDAEALLGSGERSDIRCAGHYATPEAAEAARKPDCEEYCPHCGEEVGGKLFRKASG